MPAWLLDFDGTAFETRTPPMGGMGVPEAYEQAVTEVLGAPALQRYQEAGGLRNRAPSEVVRELFPDYELSEVNGLTDQLVVAKLKRLSPQVGMPMGDGGHWPPPCDRFLDFWKSLSEYSDVGLACTAIVSSGHTELIERIWRFYGLRLPDVIVSDDTMRVLQRPPEELIKPDPYMLNLAIQLLREKLGEKARGLSDGLHQDVWYCGDDLRKDGEMARRAGVRFGHFDPESSSGLTSDGFQFSSWSWLMQHLPLGPRQ